MSLEQSGLISGQTKDAIIRSTYSTHGAQIHGLLTGSTNKVIRPVDDLPTTRRVSSKYHANYQLARQQLLSMKKFPETLSIKKAVFVVENAFLEDQLVYAAFDNVIKDYVNFIMTALKEAGLDSDNKSSRQYMLFKFMCDTLKINSPYTEGMLTHYPFQYDFEDFRADQDFTKAFVTKLMSEGTGQCHSLPLLYLILAEELDLDAYLAMAPSHSYIKIKDEGGKFYNLELTKGQFVSDGFMMGSGYITSTALQNQIYMDTLSRDQLVTQMLIDLNAGYVRKFGWDDQAIAQTEAILKENPNHVFALMDKSNAILHTMREEAKKRGFADTKSFTENHEYGKYLDRLWQAQYQKLVQLGHQDMPKEAYNAWLQSVEEKVEEQKKDIKMDNFQKF